MLGCLVARGSLSGRQGQSRRVLLYAETDIGKDQGRLDLTGFGSKLVLAADSEFSSNAVVSVST